MTVYTHWRGYITGDILYFFEGCLRAMHRAICWQKLSGVVVGKIRVSSSLEQTALKYGSLPPTKSFKLPKKGAL